MNKQIKLSELTPENVRGYKWVVMYRDHYKGNGKGEYFATADLDRIKRTQPYWFTNTDRPVHTVILSNDDVPQIIKTRYLIIQGITRTDYEMRCTPTPRRDFDGRKTRRTAPELFAAYDKAMADYTAKINHLKDRIKELQTTLNGMQYYSTTLMRIK